MNELLPFGERKMTVKEVAEALGVSERVVQLSARRLFPESIENGKTTYMNEAQVTAISLDLRSHHNLEGTFEVKTPLEKQLLIRQAMALQDEIIEELRIQLQEAAPKIALADAIGRSDRMMSITDCAKHFGLHPKCEVFPYLRARGYLTAANLPTQAAIDAGYLSLKEVKAQDGKVYPQAVVEAWQLEQWRSHVVHQVKNFTTANHLTTKSR
jgi:phage antirepressor YoqD-like protein